MMNDTQINLPNVKYTKIQNNSNRVKLVQALKEELLSFATVDIFEIFTFEDESLPLIVIRDEDDEVETLSDGNIKHNLEIQLRLYDTSYKKLDSLISKTLDSLREFKSNFVMMNLLSIDKQEVQIADKDYMGATLSISICYYTSKWCY